MKFGVDVFKNVSGRFALGVWGNDLNFRYICD